MLPGIAPTPIFRRYGNRKVAGDSPNSSAPPPVVSPPALIDSSGSGAAGGDGLLPDLVADILRSTEKITDGPSAQKRRRVIDLLTSFSDDDEKEDDEKKGKDGRFGGISAAARSKGRSATTLREAGRAKSTIDDLIYNIEGLRSELSASVQVESCVSLSKMLIDAPTRRIFRTHGLASNLVATAKELLSLQEAHEPLLFGLCAIVFQLFLDGVRPNLDLVVEPVIHLVLRALATGYSWMAEDYPQLRLLSPRHPGGSSLVMSKKSSVGVAYGEKFEHIFGTATSHKPGLFGGASMIQQPPHESGSVMKLHDLALFLVWRLTNLSEAADSGHNNNTNNNNNVVSDEIVHPLQDSNAIDLTSSSEAVSTEKTSMSQQESEIDSSLEHVLVSHMSIARDALRTAMNGHGLVVISAVCAACSKSIVSILTESGKSTSCSVDMNRVRLCLNTLENATFLSAENTLYVTLNVSIRSDLFMNTSTSKQSTSINFVTVLIALVQCITTFLLKTRLQSTSPPGRGSINEGSMASTPLHDDELQLADLIHGCLRVLVNLTNRQAKGCSAILAANRPFDDSNMLSSSSSSSLSSSSSSLPSLSSSTTSHKSITSTSWGISSIFRVITSFSSLNTSSDDLVEKSNFDSLVLAIGVLANCVEYEPSARESLLRISIEGGLSGLAGEAKGGRAPAIKFLCSLFFTRFKRLGLRSELPSSSSSSSSSPSSSSSSTTITTTTTTSSLVKATNEEHLDDSENAALNPDDVVVSSYLSLLLGCAMRDNNQVQDTVCSTLGPLLSTSTSQSTKHPLPSSSIVDKKSHVIMTIEALSLSLKAFIALQTATGTLTEETIHHVQTVQEDVFDVILRQNSTDEVEVQEKTDKGRSKTLDQHAVLRKIDVVAVKEGEEEEVVVSPRKKGFSWAKLG